MQKNNMLFLGHTYHIIVLLYCKLADVSMFSNTQGNHHTFFPKRKPPPFPHLSSDSRFMSWKVVSHLWDPRRPTWRFSLQKALLFQQRGWCFWIDYVEDVDPFCRWKKIPEKIRTPEIVLGLTQNRKWGLFINCWALSSYPYTIHVQYGISNLHLP